MNTVEYLSLCSRREVWKEGELVREWKDGSASVRTPTTGKGWLIVRKGQWRSKR